MSFRGNRASLSPFPTKIPIYRSYGGEGVSRTGFRHRIPRRVSFLLFFPCPCGTSQLPKSTIVTWMPVRAACFRRFSGLDATSHPSWKFGRQEANPLSRSPGIAMQLHGRNGADQTPAPGLTTYNRLQHEIFHVHRLFFFLNIPSSCQWIMITLFVSH